MVLQRWPLAWQAKPRPKTIFPGRPKGNESIKAPPGIGYGLFDLQKNVAVHFFMM